MKNVTLVNYVNHYVYIYTTDESVEVDIYSYTTSSRLGQFGWPISLGIIRNSSEVITWLRGLLHEAVSTIYDVTDGGMIPI